MTLLSPKAAIMTGQQGSPACLASPPLASIGLQRLLPGAEDLVAEDLRRNCWQASNSPLRIVAVKVVAVVRPLQCGASESKAAGHAGEGVRLMSRGHLDRRSPSPLTQHQWSTTAAAAEPPGSRAQMMHRVSSVLLQSSALGFVRADAFIREVRDRQGTVCIALDALQLTVHAWLFALAMASMSSFAAVQLVLHLATIRLGFANWVRARCTKTRVQLQSGPMLSRPASPPSTHRHPQPAAQKGDSSCH